MNRPTKPQKGKLHPRNLHHSRYDFPLLIEDSPALGQFVSPNQYGDLSIDFANPQAVKVLNAALLKHFYGVTDWDIPEGFLCPPIPGRADYIHYLADLLAAEFDGALPRGDKVQLLDIGTGANCIYPLIGQHQYGWHFVASDINPQAIASAQRILQANPQLQACIELRLQTERSQIFPGIIHAGECFDLTLCNPPFHASQKEATAGTRRKLRNLGGNDSAKPQLNFGGQGDELWCKGGEEAFIRKMVNQSIAFSQSVLWFTTLVSKKESLSAVYRALKKVKPASVKTIEMSQGQKRSRFVAWSFFDEDGRKAWAKRRW